MTTFADKAIGFFQSLRFPFPLPPSIQVMNPYQHSATFEIVRTFFGKFYADTVPRIFLWGINPGRFGGGVTGIPFTDPFALRTFLGIEHALSGKRELSSEFVYTVIERWGGAKKFYGTFYINNLSPLGCTRHGKNYNFYDDAQLFALTKPLYCSKHFGTIALWCKSQHCNLSGHRQTI